MIVLREHERIAVAPRWCSRSRAIGQAELDMLLYHQEQTGCRLFEPGYKSLKATSWVGTFGLGRHCLDVIPKIDSPEGAVDARQTRRSLLWMAARAGLVPVTEAEIAPLAASPHTLLTAFLQLYVRKLALEWQRGPIRQYVAEEENRPFLKGKLLFSQQLRHNLIQKQRFYTRTDEFWVDNPLSVVLKAALRRCVTQPLDGETSRLAKGLLLEFSEVSDREPTLQQLDALVVSRQHARFELLVRLAGMILRAASPGNSGAGTPMYSLMFDMNVVFERFVAAELQAALAGSGLRVRTQLGGKSLLRQAGKPKFRLIPDIGVYRKNELVCLIDTKWKKLDPEKPHYGISQADMYQMYAYGKEFDAPLTILLYPPLAAVAGPGRHISAQSGRRRSVAGHPGCDCPGRRSRHSRRSEPAQR